MKIWGMAKITNIHTITPNTILKKNTLKIEEKELLSSHDQGSRGNQRRLSTEKRNG
jgi:hypothetical protein